MGPESASRGRRDPPSPFVPVGDGGTSKSAPWGTAGPCLRHSSESDGTPLLSARRASREPFSGRPRLGRWHPQASPWERRAATPSVPPERRDPSPCHPARPFPCQPLGAAGPPNQILGASGPPVRFRGRRYPQTRPWEWRAIASDPRSRGPPGMAAGPSGGRR